MLIGLLFEFELFKKMKLYGKAINAFKLPSKWTASRKHLSVMAE